MTDGPRDARLLGVDFGRKRIGLALSDPTGTLAFPLETVTRRRGKRVPLTRLAAIAREHDVVGVVMGLPKGLDGQENPWCAEIREVASALGRRLEVPVHFVDERLTSVRAENALRAAGRHRSLREEKGRVDAAAAALILQDWLDGERT